MIRLNEVYLTVRLSSLSHIRHFTLTLPFLHVLVSLKLVKKSKQLHTYTYIKGVACTMLSAAFITIQN